MVIISALIDQARDWLASRTWIDVAEMFFVVMSVIGQHFISQRRQQGFYFWLVGNIVAVVIWGLAHRYPTALLYCYFTYNCIVGIRTWGRLDAHANDRPVPPVNLEGISRA